MEKKEIRPRRRRVNFVLLVVGIASITYIPFGVVFFMLVQAIGFNPLAYPFMSQFQGVFSSSVIMVDAILLSLVSILSIVLYKRGENKGANVLLIFAIVNMIPSMIFLF